MSDVSSIFSALDEVNKWVVAFMAAGGYGAIKSWKYISRKAKANAVLEEQNADSKNVETANMNLQMMKDINIQLEKAMLRAQDNARISTEAAAESRREAQAAQAMVVQLSHDLAQAQAEAHRYLTLNQTMKENMDKLQGRLTELQQEFDNFKRGVSSAN